MAAIVGPDYVEQEYFLSGRGTTYAESGTWGIDGRWDTQVAATGQPFRTRLLVARPADPEDFNGTVWVEWLNVSTGQDFASSLPFARRHILNSGGAWVGVSAQRAGVDQLRTSNPARYSSLDLSTDALSYDVFTQAARAIRGNPELIGAEPEELIAVGHSQSAVRLTTYVNAFQNRDDAFDAFVVHSRFSSGAPIGDGIVGSVATQLRRNVNVPVFQLQTEVEVELDLDAIQPGLGTWEDVRQPDTRNVHTWEVAGGGHVDLGLFAPTGGAATGGAPTAAGPLCTNPPNTFPTRFAADAGYAALERWVVRGHRPARAPVIRTVDGVVQRDAAGNALGGLRLPDIDVPTARYNGATTGNPLCDLLGSTVPFTPEALAARYRTPTRYVAAYTTLADLAVARRILLPEDRDEGVAAARRVTF